MSNIKFEYFPTNWNSATRITPERLNKIENAFVQLATTLATVGNEITLLKNQVVLLQGSMQSWQQTIQNDIIKDMRDELNTLNGQMNKRLSEIDDKIEDVIEAGAQAGATAGTTSADGFVRDKGYDLDAIKNWRVQKDKDDEARDSRLNLNDDWKNDYATWREENTATTKDLKTNLEAQTASIHEMTLIVGDAKTAAETAVTKATNAENTATNAAINVENSIWGANTNFEKNFNNLLNSENTRSVINKQTKTTIGRTFGMNISDGDDVETTSLQNNIKNTINKNAKIAIGRTFGMNPGDDDDIDTTSLQDNIKSTINKNARLTIGRTLGAASDDDEDIDTESLKTSLKNVTKTNVSDLGFAQTADIDSKVTAATTGLLRVDDFDTKFDTRFSDKSIPTANDIDTKVALATNGLLKTDDFNSKFDTRFIDKGVPTVADIESKVTAATTGLLKETDFDTKFNDKKVEIGKITRKSLGTVLGASLDDSTDDIPTEQLKTILNSTLQTTIGTAREGLATTTEVAAATIGLATKEEVQNEATAREQAISNEATAREQAISNATTSLATKEEVQNEATAREQAIANTATELAQQNRLTLGRAFGLTLDDSSVVDPTVLQAQIQTFTAKSLFDAQSLLMDKTTPTTTTDENGAMVIEDTVTTTKVSLSEFIQGLSGDMATVAQNFASNQQTIKDISDVLTTLKESITTLNTNIQNVNTMLLEHINEGKEDDEQVTSNITNTTPVFGEINTGFVGGLNSGALSGILGDVTINSQK